MAGQIGIQNGTTSLEVGSQITISSHLVGIAFLIAISVIILPLTRAGSLLQVSDNIKYVALSTFVLMSLVANGSLSGSRVALISYIFFIVSTAIFTAITTGVDDLSLFSLFGYILLLLMYSSFASQRGLASAMAIRVYLCFAALPFLLINFMQLSNPDAYTFGKFQFMGYLTNPNTLAYLSNVLFIALFSILQESSTPRWIKIYTGLLSVCLGMIILFSFSRSGMLSLVLAITILPITLRRRVISFATVILFSAIILAALYFSDRLPTILPERSILEDTGRTRLLGEYISELAKSGVLIGVGLGFESGRIKSELAYLDLLLFSGIGTIGFIIFWVMGLRSAYGVRSVYFGSFVFSYIAVLLIGGLFEGHIANIVSPASLLGYVIAGAAYRLSREQSSAKSEAQRLGLRNG